MAAGLSSSPDGSKPEDRMPPGMVMGPDGKPCKVCTAFRNWKPAAVTTNQKAKTPVDAHSFPGLTGVILAGSPSSSTKDETATPTSRPEDPPAGCPVDSEQLGRATWTFLHTTAAYYPEKPSATQRANMIMLLRSLPVLYPCGWCANDFGKDMEKHPPDVSSGFALSRWLCERHNAVNEKLGKDKFDCAKVDERWKDGPADGRCN